MAKGPGRCIFCGGYGLTREHVLPDWLRAIFPRVPTDTHTFGTFDWTAHRGAGALAPTRQQKQGHVVSRKVRVVCKACNTDWLSQIEETIKPLIKDLVCGYSRVLTVLDQRRLAAWIAKTTMTAEFIRPDQVAITQAEREQFRLSGEPGQHWQIWIAFYTGIKQMSGGIFHHGAGLYLPPRPIRIGVKNTQFTVIGLGRMLAVDLSTEEDRLAFTLYPQAEVALKRLWPLGSDDVFWPPAWSVDDNGADKIIASFGRTLGTTIEPI